MAQVSQYLQPLLGSTNAQELIAKLENAIFPLHKADTHGYEEISAIPGQCVHCGWVDQDEVDSLTDVRIVDYFRTMIRSLKDDPKLFSHMDGLIKHVDARRKNRKGG